MSQQQNKKPDSLLPTPKGFGNLPQKSFASYGFDNEEENEENEQQQQQQQQQQKHNETKSNSKKGSSNSKSVGDIQNLFMPPSSYFQNEDEDDDDEENQEEEQEENSNKTQNKSKQQFKAGAYVVPQLTPQQKKYAELKQKLNALRKENQKLVLEEDKRHSEPKEAEKKRFREEAQSEKEKMKSELEMHGIDPEKDKLLSVPAAEAEIRHKKMRKIERIKQEASKEYAAVDPSTHHRAHKKREQELFVDPSMREDYERQKKVTPEEDFFADADSLSYGKAPPVAPEKLDKLVDTLNAATQRRFKYHRRRPHNTDQQVDYISRTNAHFNSKVAKAFDKYTAEIRTNLERGTAI